MAPDSLSTGSLLDFLYVDRDRLSSYAAQLHNAGVLATTKQVDQSASQSSGQLGVPGTNVTGNRSTTETQERIFDASHSLPFNVLDLLDEQGFISDDIKSTGIGELFVCSGRARFLDFRLIKNSWEHILQVQMAELNAKGQHLKQGQKDVLKSNFKLLESLPHSTEFTVHTGAAHIWTFLNPTFLKVEAAALAFAYGTVLPGEWSMLATLDARPDTEEDILQSLHGMPVVREMQAGMVQAMDGIRGILGRPYTFYSATPVLIFRTIGKKNATSLNNS